MTRDGLPKIGEDDASWLSDNPNTSDVVEWVQDYALRCIAALAPPPTCGTCKWLRKSQFRSGGTVVHGDCGKAGSEE